MLLDYVDEGNQYHRRRNRVSQGFSPMHLKVYCLFFKDQNGEVLKDRNLFYLTSQNLTPAAWGLRENITKNFELGMLFFDNLF